MSALPACAAYAGFTPFTDPRVSAVFARYPELARADLLQVRELLLRTAADTAGVGPLEESLKWGEPAYSTVLSKSGSTVRMDWKPGRPDRFALYFHCRTNLVETFRTLFPDDFEFEGHRALLLRVGQPIPQDALAFCMAAALTYWLRRRRRASGR